MSLFSLTPANKKLSCKKKVSLEHFLDGGEKSIFFYASWQMIDSSDLNKWTSMRG